MGVRRGDGADYLVDGISSRFDQLREGDTKEADSLLTVVADHKLRCIQCDGPLGEGSQGDFCAICAAYEGGSTD